jgi:hypothetical protein
MDEVGAVSNMISAISKLPSGNGLAMSKMPGSVVPGPFGSFVLAGAVVGLRCGGFGDGEADGAAAAEGVLLATGGADRGSSASR